MSPSAEVANAFASDKSRRQRDRPRQNQLRSITHAGADRPVAQPTLRAKRLGLHTQHQAVVIMRTDCHVCRSEGLAARSQVLVSTGNREVQATLFQIEGGELIALDEVSLSETAWTILGVADGEAVKITHAPAIESLQTFARRIYGNRLDAHRLCCDRQGTSFAGRYTDDATCRFPDAIAAFLWTIENRPT